MKTIFFLLFSILSFAQQIKSVDFLKCNATIFPDFETKTIAGECKYIFEVKKKIDTIRIDAKDIDFHKIKVNNKNVAFKVTPTQLLLFEGFRKGKNTLNFDYRANPKQTLYFTGTKENMQIWTQGQGKYTSYWLPSFDDVNEKVVFNISVIFSDNYIILSNGNFINGNHKKNRFKNEKNTLNFQMKKPMSSYLVMLAIGNFEKQETKSKSGTLLEFYLDKKDISKFEPTYRYSKQIFDYLEQEIGVKYPWRIYRQVPVRDFLYAGMENTTSTIFAQDFVVDSIGFNDKNYINVNAHELAHQWFGDLITAKSSKHHWLQEGFATYYALLAEKKVFGEDYFYNELYDYALQLRSASKTDTVAVMNEKASSLSFYKKGAWALHCLREDIGAKKFQKAVKKYLKKFQFKNVDTDEFLTEVKKIEKDFDVNKFKQTWLEKFGFDMKLAESYLKKNKAVSTYIKLTKEKEDIETYKTILLSEAYFPIKQFIFYKLANVPFQERKELIEIGMKQNLYVRQAIAETVNEVPSEFQKEYETFLYDESYKTREIALNTLSKNFPTEVNKYLKILENQYGNNDLSLRICWLKNAILEPEISEFEKSNYLKEIQNYADITFESSIRQNALEVLNKVNKYDLKNIELLFKATSHHKWQFIGFSKKMVRQNLKDAKYKNFVEQLSLNANEIMKPIYFRFLNEKPN